MSVLLRYASHRRLQLVLGLALALILALAASLAADAYSRTSSRHAQTGARSIQAPSSTILGTWRDTVSITGPPARTVHALVTFTPGGGVVESENDAPGVGQGSWASLGHGRYAFTFQAFSFAAGNPIGYSLIRQTFTLRHDTWSGPFVTDFFDTQGNHVNVLARGTATAHRFQVQLLG
jgi:hypothetical protein